MNRKSVKLFSEFYSSDVIVASPLGLRTAIEKDGSVAGSFNVATRDHARTLTTFV